MKQSQNVHQKRYPLGLVRRHPIISVFALWVVLLLLAGLSTKALVNVNNSREAKIPATEPSTSEMSTQHSTAEYQKSTFPWLPFGAIALIGTLGCLFLSQTLRSTGYQPIQRKTSRTKAAILPQSTETDSQDSPASLKPQPDGLSNAPLLGRSVTVVPKQQNHPLDWDEPSLADSLDMRQRRPLSHWL